jgi:GTPase Era involved in 16S rRNA processing
MELDTVTAFYAAQAKHNRQLARLTAKPLAKWKSEDFEALKATRAARDSAVAALTYEQKLKHVERLTRESIQARAAQALQERAAAELRQELPVEVAHAI